MGPQSPLYLQLRELIRSKIENGEYPPGTAIPSVGTLAEKYGIHRLSVRSAISALIGEGLLKSVQGKGIFVVGEKLEQDLETVGGFEQTLKASAKHFEQRLLVKASRTAGPLYASWLNCLAEEPLYYVKRLSLLDGEPLSLEEAYIPQCWTWIPGGGYSPSSACAMAAPSGPMGPPPAPGTNSRWSLLVPTSEQISVT